MLTLWICLASFSLANCLPKDYLNNPTQKGLDYVRQIGVPFLEKELLTLPIPDLKGTAKTPVGSIAYELTSITIKDALIPKSNLTVNADTGLTILCQNAELNVNSNWKYRENNWPHIKDSGSVILTMKGINLDISIDLESHNETHPSIETRKCSLGINEAHLKFSGGASWLYNLFSDTIANELKSSISEEVCRAVSKMIDEQGNKLITHVPDIISSIKTQISLLTNDKKEIAHTKK